MREVNAQTLGDVLVRLSTAVQGLQGSRAVLADRFDSDGPWYADGARSATAWLRWKCGEGYGPASAVVEAGEVTRHLPEVGAAWRRGRIAEGHVRALRRALARFPRLRPHLVGAQEQIIALAQEQEPKRFWAALQRLCRSLDPEGYDTDRREPEYYLHASTIVDGDVKVDALLPPDVGAQLVAMLEAARRLEPPTDDSPPPREDRRLSSLNVEALHRILSCAASANLPTVAGARPVVHVTVDADALVTGSGMGWLERFGVPETPVSAEFARRLACDATVRPLILDSHGDLVVFGSAARTVPPPLRRYVLTRDRHCRFAGCRSRIDEVHHIVFYSRGGLTRSDNLLGLCWFHHHLVHEGGWTITGDANVQVRGTGPHGRSWNSGPPGRGPTEVPDLLSA